MSGWHISDDNVVRKCRATKRPCKYLKIPGRHFATEAEALARVEHIEAEEARKKRTSHKTKLPHSYEKLLAQRFNKFSTSSSTIVSLSPIRDVNKSHVDIMSATPEDEAIVSAIRSGKLKMSHVFRAT